MGAILHRYATENGIKDCVISSNAGKSLREFYSTILRIVAIVSLIDSLGGAVHIQYCLTKESVFHNRSVTSLFRSLAKMVQKWQNFQLVSISQARRLLQL